MRVNVLCFGVLKELVGNGQESVEIVEGACVGDLIACLRGRTETGAAIWGSVAVAVNRDYVRSGTVLKEGDEVAILPPVSGGRDAR